MLICKLCLIKIESNEMCKQFSKENLKMLEIFFLDMESYLMAGNICNYCNEKLRKNYEFKIECLLIKEENSSKDFSGKLNILCRICLKVIEDINCLLSSKNYEANNVAIMLQTCLPEIFNVQSKNSLPKSIICLKCWNQLRNCFEFTNMCRKNQKIALENDELSTINKGIKIEITDENMKTISTDDSEDSLKCKICRFQAKTKATLVKHELVHNEPRFKCNICSYKGKRMEYLKSHMLIHEEPSLQCKHCPYKARSKRTLKNHNKLLHTKNKGAEFPCPKCSYKGKRIDYLKSHMLVHLDCRSETECQLFKCDLCSYKTKRKHDLKYHMLVHESQVIYNCSMCPYKSKRKKNLTRHVENHKKIKSKFF